MARVEQVRRSSVMTIAVACVATFAWAWFGAGALAQSVDVRAAEDVADEAVAAWAAGRGVDAGPVLEMAGKDAEAFCASLPARLASPPPPRGTVIVVDDRVERPTGDAGTRSFTYAAKAPSGRLDVAEVVLTRSDERGDWAVTRVGWQRSTTGGREWTGSPWAQGAFAAFTAWALIASFTVGSPLRRVLRHAVQTMRSHVRTVAWTMVAGWTVVGLGLWVGSGLPDACTVAIEQVVQTALDDVGARSALASGNVLRVALTIFYQNFVMVTVTVLFTLAAALGVPAYLFAGISFFVQTVAFGALGPTGLGEILLVGVLFVVEFTAYFSVVAGGGILIASWVGGGGAGLRAGYARLAAIVPWAGAWLLFGAWYEALILVIASTR